MSHNETHEIQFVRWIFWHAERICFKFCRNLKAGSRCNGNEGFDFALPMEREHPVVQLHFVYFVILCNLCKLRVWRVWRGRCLLADKLNFKHFPQVARVAPELGKALRLCVGFRKGTRNSEFVAFWKVCQGFLIWVFLEPTDLGGKDKAIVGVDKQCDSLQSILTRV